MLIVEGVGVVKRTPRTVVVEERLVGTLRQSDRTVVQIM